MAHLVTGIDIGVSSVKCVCIDAGFRRSRIVDTFEVPVADGDTPLPERQMAAVAEAVAQIKKESQFFVAMDGDRLSIRELSLPFSDPRKVAQVVPYELEGQIVLPLEEVVFDHMVLDGDASSADVLAASVRSDDVGVLLDRLSEVGVTPRSVYAAPLCYRTVVDEVEAASSRASMEQAVVDDDMPGNEGPTVVEMVPDITLLLDVGFSRTNLAIMRDGQPLFARTLMRGGKHLTDAVASAFEVPYERAEQAKVERGVVAHNGYAAGDNTDEKLSQVLREALAPLLRDIRQSVASFRGRFRHDVTQLTVVGGGGQLRGLNEALSEELDIPALAYDPLRGGMEDDVIDLPDGRYALAEAIAWSGVLGTPQIDLRRGAYVYKASFSIVRQKAWRLGALAAAVMIAVVLNGTMAYSKAHQEKERLEKDLEEATTELFGKPDRKAASVRRLMERGFREEMPPIPSSTAYDLLRDISARLPTHEDVKLDVTQIDIRPRKTFIKGIIDSVSSVDKVVDSLKDHECFEEIAKGSITEVTGGDKNFTLTIKSTCP